MDDPLSIERQIQCTYPTTQHIPSFLFTSRVLQGFAISAHCFYCWECFELTIGSYFSETSSLHANLFQLSHQTDVLQNLEMRSKVFSFEIFWCYTNGKKSTVLGEVLGFEYYSPYYFKVTFKWEKEVCKTLGRTSYQQENMFLKELTLWNQKFPQDPLLYNIFICEYPGGNSTEIYVSWNWWSPAFGFHWESK